MRATVCYNACMPFETRLTPEMIARLRSASARGQKLEAGSLTVSDVRIAVASREYAPADGAVLFDSAGGDAGQFTFLSVAFADKAITADALDPELTLLLFVGDLAAPRARVKLADILRQGGRRPLNLRRAAGQPVRLTLADPSGAWKGGVPAMEIVLSFLEKADKGQHAAAREAYSKAKEARASAAKVETVRARKTASGSSSTAARRSRTSCSRPSGSTTNSRRTGARSR